jgi:RecA-family ATPase
MPRAHNEYPFSAQFQADLVALLLRQPDLYRKYANCWRKDAFDCWEIREILDHWVQVYALSGQVPDRAALENSLTFNRVGATDTEAVLKTLDQLFNRPLENVNVELLLTKLLEVAKDKNFQDAMGNAIDEMSTGTAQGRRNAVNYLVRAEATGPVTINLEGREWYRTPPALNKEIIPGILQRGKIGILNGHAKSYKSWALLHLGISVAAGRGWWFGALPPARVLYVNMELDAEAVKVRVDKIVAGMGLSREALEGWMDFLNLEGFDSECSLEKIEARLRLSRDPARPWELILIDPVYMLLTAGRDLDTENIENNNSAVGAMFCTLKELARELNAAIFLCHHFKKGNLGETMTIDSGAGAGMFGRRPDAIFALHPASEDGETVKGAYVVKSEIRYFPSPDDFGIRLDPNSLIFYRDITINPANIAGKNGRPQLHHIGKILVILQNQTFTYKQWKDRAKDQYGIHPDRMGIFRDEAMEKSYVLASGPTTSHKTTYTLTPLGEEAIVMMATAVSRNGYLGEKMREMKARMNGNGN